MLHATPISTRRLVSAAATALSLLCTSCGGGGDGGTTAPVDNYLPIISNFYKNILVSAHTLTLASPFDGKASGTFSGSESLPGTPGAGIVSGSFVNSKATVTIARSTGTVTYSGTFYGRDSLLLTRTGETLRFAK